jgi:hypothetical protein
MKISGFTFVRNAVKFDYPVVESITSILPIVDEFIVSVGNSDDNTLQLIESIASPKIKIFHSEWDNLLREEGKVLATETNKALAQISPDADWAFYLQADEVVHEKDLTKIVTAASSYLNNDAVEGLLFNYFHFYGTYDYIGNSHKWYDKEIRIIRNNNKIISYRDAQGFRTKQNDKLKVKQIDACIYHYGWVRHPKKQQEKLNNFSSYWAGEQNNAQQMTRNEKFDFLNHVDIVDYFNGTHPAVMKKRIEEKNWKLDFDVKKKNIPLKDHLLHIVEKRIGKRLFIYKNYKII